MTSTQTNRERPAPTQPASPVNPADVKVGEALPERSFTPTMAELFLYSAIIWNPHRIHYDIPYVTESEGYPGAVITGPLQGDWLLQGVTEWMGEGALLERFSYRNKQAAYLGETLTTGGSVSGYDPGAGRATLALHVRNEGGEVITPGEAVVRFAATP